MADPLPRGRGELHDPADQTEAAAGQSPGLQRLTAASKVQQEEGKKKKRSLKSGAAWWRFSSVFWPNTMEPQSSAWTWRNFSPYRIIFGSFSLPSIICKSANSLLLFFFLLRVFQSLMFFQLCSQLLLGVYFQTII